MIRLKQSTASQEVPLGPFVDATDGFTPETALTIANTDIKVWKNGASALVDKNSGGATHMAGGVYSIVLDATDTNTLGPLVLTVGVAAARPIRVECEVLPALIFDSLGTNFGIAADLKAMNGAVEPVAGIAALGLTIGTAVVGVGPTQTSIPVAVDFSNPQDLFRNVDQIRGKRIDFTFNTGNDADSKGMSARIVSHTAASGSFPTTTATLTVEPPLPVTPVAGDIFTISDGALPGLTPVSHVKASIEALQESTQAATALRRLALTGSYGTLAAGSTQTVLQISGAMTPALTGVDQVKGRVVLIVDEAGSQAGLKLQGGKINASTTTSITLETPLTTAPAAGNVIIIL